MKKQDNPRASRGYILPSLVLVFALLLSIFAYNNYRRDNQDISGMEEAVSPATAPALAGNHDEKIQQLEQLLSRTRSDLELQLHELEQRLPEYPGDTEHTDDRDDELSVHLEEWQASVNQQLSRMHDGLQATVESLEARIAGTAPTDSHVSVNQPEPAHIDLLEQRLADLDQQLAQITNTYATRLDHMENSLRYLTASRDESPYDDTTPFQATDQTQLLLLQKQFNQATSKHDARLEHIENSLQYMTASRHKSPYDDTTPSRPTDQAQLLLLQEQFNQATSKHDVRLRELGMLLEETDSSSRKRIDEIEESLEMTAERLEAIIATVASASSPEDTATIRAANEAIKAEPPAAVQGKSQSISRTGDPATISSQNPTPPAQKITGRQDISRQDNPMTVTGWSVNLASYSRERIAENRLEDFTDKGVMVEKHATTVRGKTMYRLRVTGFDSLESARSSISGIKQKLGLQEVWISRN